MTIEKELKQAADLLRKHGAIVLLREEIVIVKGVCTIDDFYAETGGDEYLRCCREQAAYRLAREAGKYAKIERELDPVAGTYKSHMKATGYVIRPDSARRALEQFGRSSQIPPPPRVTDIFGDPDMYEIVQQPPDLRHLKL